MTVQRRGRGVVLTDGGWEKLENSLHEWENTNNSDKPYTIEALIEVTQLDPATISKVLRREIAVDRRTLERFFRGFNLELDKSDYTKLVLSKNNQQNQYFCSEVPDVSIFFGRAEELNILQKWIVIDCCRLITLVGIGGIGKTSLSAKVIQNLRNNFDLTIWFSLRNAPPPLEIITNLLQVLSNGEEVDLARNISVLINKLIEYLQNQRSLIVFDNVDAVFCDSNYAGNYLSGYESYGELFQKLGETSHQSCLLMTSREKPKEISAIEGKELPARCLQISGLGISEVKQIFQGKGITNATDSNWQQLTINYGGNPLYLKFIASTVLDLFDGNIAEFLVQSNRSRVFGDVRNLIARQFNRLSELEQSLLYWLAINQDAVDLKELLSDLVSQPFSLLEILESLNRRSLIEKNKSKFSLQSVVMEYVTTNYIDQISQEISSGDISLFKSHALLKATSPDYIQDIQKRLIITPILEGLEVILGSQHQVETSLRNILSHFRGKSPLLTGYAVGNIINLLSHLSSEISNQDFSNLNIRQANLQGISLNNVDFSNSHFTQTTFSNTFGIIFSLAFNTTEEFLVTGSIDGEVCLWKWQTNQQVFKNHGHKTIVESVAFSLDSLKIASSSRDRSIKIWDASTGECILTLESPNQHTVKNLVFHRDGSKLFGYSNRSIISWDLNTGNSRILIESQSRICSLILSEDDILIFGCDDGAIFVWDINTEELIDRFSTNSGIILSLGHTKENDILTCGIRDKIVTVWNLNNSESIEIQSQSYNISLIDISNNGKFLATGSGEKTIKIWDIDTGLYLQSLSGHLSEINAIAFGSKNQILATASVDRTVKIWDVTTGKCLKTLQGRADYVHSAILSSDNRTIISGSQHTINFWDIDSQQCIYTLFKTKDWLSSLIVSQDEKTIACANIGNEDNVIRIWQINDLNNCLTTSNKIPSKILKGHDDSIWSFAFNSDGKKIVSGSSDRTVKVWDSDTAQCLKTFYGHNRPVLSVSFSPDENIIASCGGHSIIKLWNVETGECFQTIQERASYIIKFNCNGLILASGHTSGIVKLWDTNSAKCLQTLGNFGKPIISLAFSYDGNFIAYGSYDGTVTVWDINKNKSIAILQEKFSSPWSLTFSKDSNLLAVGRDSEIIQLWDIKAGKIVAFFQGDRHAEKVNITGVTGLTAARIANLIELGAYN
ncbi:WD40 repeat-containing protein [Rivularia sp. PCC 7116]|uniref:NB-ARC domain-containing protein n=1 Tax=Rivularia sp. PCC 7116 TaxID=373994 RepID=UPI00029EF7DE|nr:NB-ARC domain-containing protein [Rivularia sp. PCC 7116]AFY53837.1 WD40 repeat-containing protein [Rivularia sp. PCC 7116]